MAYFITAVLSILFFLLFRNLIIKFLNNQKEKVIEYGIDSQKVLNIFSIVLAVISVLLTLRPETNLWLNEKLQNYMIQLLVVFLVFLIFMLYRMNAKDDTIKSLQNDLRSETKDLWKNYGQLHQFYKEQNLQRLLEIFVNSKAEVISIQRYKYNVFSDLYGLTVKVQGDYNYIREKTDINTVSQGYYLFDLEYISKLRHAYASSKKSLHTENLNDDDYKELINLYGELGRELIQTKSKSEDYTDIVTYKFQLLLIIRKELSKGLEKEIPLPPFSALQLSLLQEKRKSGMEIASFLLKNHIGIIQEREIFEYQGNSDSKMNRCYSNIQVQTGTGENYVFVIAQHLNNAIDKKSQKNKALNNAKDFIEMIEKEFYFIK